MTGYTPAERCMLLLFARLGEEKPLTSILFRTMAKMLEALGTGAFDPDAQVTQGELLRLGLRPDEAQAALRRLDREQALDLHLNCMDEYGIRVVTRVSPGYPARLRRVLGDRAPMLLYCAGNLRLFDTECAALVGSRKLRAPGLAFAEAFGGAAAAEHLTYVSGGAAGADTAGFDAAWNAGGRAVLFPADSLRERRAALRERLDTGRLLLVCEDGFDEHFSIRRAYARNRLIHVMGERVFVAQSDYGTGGTWQGVMENLKHGWSPVHMCSDEPEDPGTRGLMERGCIPVRTRELHDLRRIGPEQINLLETYEPPEAAP